MTCLLQRNWLPKGQRVTGFGTGSRSAGCRSAKTETKNVSVLETAIRNALERPDRSDPDLRARVYQSARHALENGMKKQGVTDIDIIVEQRQRLEALIQAIEAEERIKAAAPPPSPLPMEQPAPRIDAPKTRSATPELGPQRHEPEFFAQPHRVEPEAAEDVWSVVPERQGQIPKTESRVSGASVSRIPRTIAG